MRTTAHLIGAGFRLKPWRIAGAVAGGFLLYWLGGERMEQTVAAILDFRRQPHIHPYYTWPQAEARMFWAKYGVLAGHFLLSMFIGCIVAAVAKAREMVATIIPVIFTAWRRTSEFFREFVDLRVYPVHGRDVFVGNQTRKSDLRIAYRRHFVMDIVRSRVVFFLRRDSVQREISPNK